MNRHEPGSEQERVEALFASGRISREQADRLLDALQASDAAEEELAGLKDDAAARPDAGSATRETAADTGTPQELVAIAAGPLKWLEISTFAGDIDVKADPGLQEPAIRHGELKLTPEGARVSMEGDGQTDFLDRLIEGFSKSSLKIRIPADWGVRFDVKGGDIDIEGPVAAVVGHLVAGDLEIEDTRAADVSVTAGEAEVGLRADSGEHQVRVRVGNASVRLLPGSSLRVDMNVNIGSIKARDLDRHSQGIGMRAAGTVTNGGTGEGTLNIDVLTGEAELRAVRP